MSLTKFGVRLFVAGLILIPLSVLSFGVLLPVFLFADSPGLNSTMNEIGGVLGFVFLRVGPAALIGGVIITIIGIISDWWRQGRTG